MLTPKLIARGPVFPPATNIDGSIMAWSNRLDGTRDIYLKVGDTTTQLTKDKEVDAEPALTPEGDILVWSRRVGNDWDLYQRVDGGIEPLIEDPGPQRKPKISKDGSTLVFEDRGGIGLMREGEREWFAQPEGDFISRRPKVSADGSRVFWERYNEQDRTTALWVRDQNGQEKEILSKDIGFSSYAQSRNGQQLTYTLWTDKGNDLHVWHMDRNEHDIIANKEDVNEAFPDVTEDGKTTYYTLSDFRQHPKVNTYLFRDHEGKKKELVTRDPNGRNLFSFVTDDEKLLHWMWIDDADPNNRALLMAEVESQ